MNNKIILYSLEAEQAILSSIILENDCWEIVSKNLIKEDFYKKSHKIIFNAIEKLNDQAEPVDIITLSNMLQKTNELDAIGGLNYLNAIVKYNSSYENIDFYLNIVKEKSALRNIISISKGIINYILENKHTNLQNAIDYAEEKIISLSKKYTFNEDFIASSDVLIKTLKRIEDLHLMSPTVIGLPSGFDELDKMTLGFNKSDLIIIAGRPSMGKTAFAMNIVEHVSVRLKKPILIFSMEMTANQIMERMLASLSKVSLSKVKSGLLDSVDWPRIRGAVEILSESEFYICDYGPLDLLTIKSIARRAINAHKNLSAIIIDYIQLIKIAGKSDNRVQELSEISRSLKALARELDIPIIVLSQLNRSLETRTDKKPIMSDIRESGAIEQDADLIIFIYRDEVYNKYDNNGGKAEIIISKQRNGPIGSFKLNFLAEFLKFETINKDYFEFYNE